MTFRVSECSLPLTIRFLEDYVLQSIGRDTTRLSWRVCYTPNPWLRPAHPILRPFFGRDFDKAAQSLLRCAARLGNGNRSE
jgi:hypothetical protein